MANKYSPYPGDIVDAKLEPGEFVLNRNAVDAVGVDQLKELNDEVAPRFAKGGRIYNDDDVEFDEDREMRPPVHMNEGGDIIWDKLQADRKFNKAQYDNPSVLFKDQSRRGREQRLEQADKIALNQATNARIKQYHDEVKALEHKRKMRELTYANAMYGPSPLKIRKDNSPIHINLQPAEIPTGDQFNADDFNSMLGAKKTMDDFFVRQDMVDGSGRTPMDDDFGQIQGLDPREYIQKKNPKKFDTSEQLLMKIQGSTSSTDRYLDESNPALQQTFKDNPWLALEAQNKTDSNRAQEEALKLKQDTEKRLYESDLNITRADKLKAAEEYSKHNSKSVEEWLSAEPERGPKKTINPETGKPFETMEAHDQRLAREEIVKQAKAASRQARVDKASTYSKSKRKRQQMGADRKSWESYLQDGGFIPRHYNEGDVVEELSFTEKNRRKKAMIEYERLKEVQGRDPEYYKRKYGDQAPVDPSAEWNSTAQAEAPVESAQIAQKAGELDLKNAKPVPLPKPAHMTDENIGSGTGPPPPALSAAPKPKPTVQELASQAEGLGEKTVGAVKDFGQKAYQGAGNFLKKAYGRFGGDAWKASKAMNIEADLNADVYDDTSMGDMSVSDDLKASNKEMAMMMRDEFGEGQGDWEMAKGQGKQRLKDDFETVLGAGVAGVGAAGAYAYDKGKKAIRAGRDWVSDEEGYEQDFSKVQSGEAQGSNMQRVGRGVGMLGELFKDASQFQGYEGGDWGKYQRPDPKAMTDVDEIDLATGKKKNQSASSEDIVQLEQEGGPITLEGFIQQSWRNM